MYEYSCEYCEIGFELSWLATGAVRCPECLRHDAYADEKYFDEIDLEDDYEDGYDYDTGSSYLTESDYGGYE